MKKYDLIVIGGGAGGLLVAAGAAHFGVNVALIDASSLGGDCLWTGCVPTKSLIDSAKMVHYAKRSEMFGISIKGKPAFLMARDRIRYAIHKIQKHDDPERFRRMGVDVIQSTATFKNAHQLRLSNGETVWGKRIVVATGSHPFIPPIKGLNEAGYMTNEHALQLEKQPESLLVVGGGPIGLEFAQVFARFGTKVTVVEREKDILSKEDPDVVPFVRQALEQEGVQFITGGRVEQVEKKAEGKEVTIVSKDQQIKLMVEELLVAVGRKPNIENLKLERAGVKVECGAIAVNERLQTSVPHIYAVGDVIGRYLFTHAAGYEGTIVISNVVFGLRKKIDYSHLPWVTYTDPEVFHLGYTEPEARERYGDIQVFKTELEEVDRFIIEERYGFVKIITNRKGRIIGAHAVGPSAGEWMQEVVLAKKFGHTVGDVAQVIHPYPTQGSAIQVAAAQYWRNALFSGSLSKWLKTYVRWFR